MGDLISRKKLLDSLEPQFEKVIHQVTNGSQYYTGFWNGLVEAKKTIDSALSLSGFLLRRGCRSMARMFWPILKIKLRFFVVITDFLKRLLAYVTGNLFLLMSLTGCPCRSHRRRKGNASPKSNLSSEVFRGRTH